MDKDEDGPERTCIVTRRKAMPDALIRFVAGPEGTVVPDIRRRLPGRGVWVTASQTLVAEATRRQAFSRGLKTKVIAAATLPAFVDRLLLDDALQSLAMANKAGRVTTGFAKVEAAVNAGGVAALIHAADAAADGVRKLAAAGRRRAGPDGTQLLDVKLFSGEELELALGRTNVIHAALAEGPASQAFLTRCRRLMAYRLAAAHHTEAEATQAPA